MRNITNNLATIAVATCMLYATPRATFAASSDSPKCLETVQAFTITYNGYGPPQQTALENAMSRWHCATFLDVNSLSVSNASYLFKTKAGVEQVLADLREVLDTLKLTYDMEQPGTGAIIVTTPKQ